MVLLLSYVVNLKKKFAGFVSFDKIDISKTVKTCEKCYFLRIFCKITAQMNQIIPAKKKYIFVVMTCIGHDISKQFITGVDGSR